MINVMTPFRISFLGGSTDYPSWLKDHDGAVLSTTINKYCYLSIRYLPPFFPHKYRIRYNITERKNKLEYIKHPVVRECIRFMNIEKGLEVIHTADIPARSGIGSSSAFTVGFLHGLSALCGEIISKRKLASDAIYIEQDILKENVGCQDQIACAFGNLNKIIFLKNKKFIVEQITLKDSILERFAEHVMMFFIGTTRISSEVTGKYVGSLSKKEKILIKMYELVDLGVEALQNIDFKQFGKILDESWQRKKELSDIISNRYIDEAYKSAISAGAYAGKICGGGSGGFLMIFADISKQDQIKKALQKFLYVPIKFDTLGSRITMYSEQVF
jgi:D-glycero-alpha-D-manno-heptose-7-phosphate kinase